MTKDWDQYKTEIEKLYISNGKSLNDVRRILKGRHGFDASIRGYRLKLEHWGIKKNKVPLGHGAQTRPRRKTRAGTIAGPSSGAHPSHEVADLLEGNTLPSLPHPESNATLWQGFNFPALNDTSLPTHSLHDSSNAPYVSLNREVGWPSGPDIFKTISEGSATDLLEQLSCGVSVDIRDNFNDSPLHAAIRKGNIDMAKALLKYGADVDASGYGGRSPLHLSVGSKKMLQILLKYHPKTSLQDDEGDSALHYLIRLNSWWEYPEHQFAIRSLLFAGANSNIQNKAGDSPLHRIIAEAMPASTTYMEMVLEFLNCKPEVTTPMRNGQALLEVFLENTNILQRNKSTYSIPEWQKAGFRCLEKFLAAGANPNFPFHSQPFLHCCLEGSSIVREVTDARGFLLHLVEKADIDIPASNGDYPLHSALSMNDVYGRGDRCFLYCQIASTLIARQVDVNKLNRAGKSPLELWLTSYRPQKTLMKVTTLLIGAGASTTITTTAGESLFDVFTRQSRECRIVLTKTLLIADIKAQQPATNVAAAPEWVEVWRSAWQASLWGIAKASLSKLDALAFRPKSKDFMECAFLIIAERLLERHKTQLTLLLKKKIDRESAAEDREEYCAILRDCRERKADIDASFYHFLLDIMDI